MKKAELLAKFEQEAQAKATLKAEQKARREAAQAQLNVKETCLVEFNGFVFELSLSVRKLAPSMESIGHQRFDKVFQAFHRPRHSFQVDPIDYQQSLKNHSGLALQNLAIGLLIGEIESESAQIASLVEQLSTREVNVALI